MWIASNTNRLTICTCTATCGLTYIVARIWNSVVAENFYWNYFLLGELFVCTHFHSTPDYNLIEKNPILLYTARLFLRITGQVLKQHRQLILLYFLLHTEICKLVYNPCYNVSAVKNLLCNWMSVHVNFKDKQKTWAI